jgi:hypothetical protein
MIAFLMETPSLVALVLASLAAGVLAPAIFRIGLAEGRLRRALLAGVGAAGLAFVVAVPFGIVLGDARVAGRTLVFALAAQAVAVPLLLARKA